ncbi:hypothetical protein F5880DRAFT_1611623 [Lentinula raphanica]|nr:hypothetical protein F5880DRAFT_1611623 [Lentinula raphanica]
MTSSPYLAPIEDSLSTFKDNIFSGKVLFCTGGGSGICKGMTRAIMRHGANAAIIGRNIDRLTETSKELSEQTGKTCIPIRADVRQPQTLQDAVRRTIEKFGRIDFVICGAAGNFMSPISSLSENAFRTVVEIDTLGTCNTVKATIPHVRDAKGAYIHVSTTLHHRGTPYQIHVSAAKAGVDAMSNVIAVEEGPHGVRSNVLAPGFTSGTEGMRLMTGKTKVKADGFSTPLGRFTEIQDVANAAVFLFSPAACYITGQIIPVDGGAEHLRGDLFPYPSSVIDPSSVRKLLKGKM